MSEISEQARRAASVAMADYLGYAGEAVHPENEPMCDTILEAAYPFLRAQIRAERNTELLSDEAVGRGACEIVNYTTSDMEVAWIVVRSVIRAVLGETE